MNWRLFEGKDVIITTTEGKTYSGYVFYFSPGDECDDGVTSLDVEFEDGRLVSFDIEDIRHIEVVQTKPKKRKKGC